MPLDINVHISGPLFDGTAARAMREGQQAVRHEVADAGEEKVRAAFTAMIKVNHGVFLGSVTQTDVSRVYSWSGTWTRDADNGTGARQTVTRTYTMPIVVTDPAVQTIVTTENAMYGPWLEGHGSRNLTTRFKGYHGYRIAATELNAEAGTIADAVMQPFIERCRLWASRCASLTRTTRADGLSRATCGTTTIMTRPTGAPAMRSSSRTGPSGTPAFPRTAAACGGA